MLNSEPTLLPWALTIVCYRDQIAASTQEDAADERGFSLVHAFLERIEQKKSEFRTAEIGGSPEF
jgi:hypothetical protein